ncbi:acyl carrier protein [Candidatus Epulonipiscium fishelsonii]|uniref:Acyl carrier protein n=1 Tax=Candidatus Epulonipiscium fishelsonii TaxID=77094 RepID=A0ACC8X9D3_9FIRM|nr:acyl carrier protein [Epulopiscium sp. SCG-D08WGA-EpuloA1]OON95722.1 MAG: acyl carrier protein [Epulopiscium sp. AS2M-Bin002]
MVFKKLQEIIADKLSVDESEVTMQSNFKDDLEADSLDLYEIIMSLEDEFGVTIQNEDLEDIKTVSDAVKYIEDRQ